MKRSEAVKIIKDELENIHYNGLDSIYGFDRLSTDLLKKLEETGMMPPEVSITKKNWTGEMLDDPFYIAQEWEEEDEKK